SSLARLLDEHRPEWRRDLRPELILGWANAHHAATGQWPTRRSGPVSDAPGESWLRIDYALREGFRGLPGGSSLALLLDGNRPERRRTLTHETILAWGAAHHAATGRWPTACSGEIAGAPGEKWINISEALRLGQRGLPAGG